MRLIDADALLDALYDNEFQTLCPLDEVSGVIAASPTLDYAPVRHGEWVLTESPYAEHEEAFDGESHDRWTCSLCGGEAGFECDPDGFAGFQEKTKFCGHCGAKMDSKK